MLILARFCHRLFHFIYKYRTITQKLKLLILGLTGGPLRSNGQVHWYSWAANYFGLKMLSIMMQQPKSINKCAHQIKWSNFGLDRGVAEWGNMLLIFKDYSVRFLPTRYQLSSSHRVFLVQARFTLHLGSKVRFTQELQFISILYWAIYYTGASPITQCFLSLQLLYEN